MQWVDEGVVIGGRDHGEHAVILEVLTRDHGRHLGVVPGGRSRRLRPVLQPGNTVAATWRARTDDQLGTFAVEPAISRAANLIGSSLALYGLGALALHLRLLPERDPHPDLFAAATILLDALGDPDRAASLFCRFELILLAELGYGLDLTACAATGATTDLVFVSPRTGRAVSRDAGAPYSDRLLPLPPFLAGGQADAAGLAAGFALTGHFLALHAFGPAGRPVPPERERFVAEAVRSAETAPVWSGGAEGDSPRDASR